MFKNYDIYDGEWLDDRIAGQGTMIYGSYGPDEEDNLKPRYIGSWRNNLREGFGMMVLVVFICFLILNRDMKMRVFMKEIG